MLMCVICITVYHGAEFPLSLSDAISETRFSLEPFQVKLCDFDFPARRRRDAQEGVPGPLDKFLSRQSRTSGGKVSKEGIKQFCA